MARSRDPAVAQQIIAECVAEFADNQGDCNQFLKAVANHFFQSTGFDGKNADGIIAYAQNSPTGWVDLQGDPSVAITTAKNGDFVFAGMTSTALNQNNGHVAVVVGEDGQPSGAPPVTVPMCYAGSLGGAAISDGKISETFPAIAARNGQVQYFSKTPDIQPSETAFGIVLAAALKIHRDRIRARRKTKKKTKLGKEKSKGGRSAAKQGGRSRGSRTRKERKTKRVRLASSKNR
jgi:hypothetical protein